MAQISVSLPDELKARMDAYAQAHPDMGTSDIVQAALEQFLTRLFRWSRNQHRRHRLSPAASTCPPENSCWPWPSK